MLLLFTLVLFTLQSTSMPFPEENSIGATPIGKPGCQTKCGEVTVPYPFGINSVTNPAGGTIATQNCSLDELFALTCNLTYIPPKLFFGELEVRNISISDSEMTTAITLAYRCYNTYGEVTESHMAWTRIGMREPFTFSQKNKLTVVGCDDYAWIRGTTESDYASGCMGLCTNPSQVPNGSCTGLGCCQTSLPKGLKYFDVNLGSFSNHTSVMSFNPCSFAFVSEENSFQFDGASVQMSDPAEFYNKTRSNVYRILDWEIGGNPNCSQPTICKGNSFCKNASTTGYHCSCNQGYEGNPYLEPGCQDINECNDKRKIPCYGICNNTPGSYNCTCPSGQEGDVTKENGCQLQEKSTDVAKDSNFQAVEYALVAVFVLLAIIFGITGIYFIIRKKKLMKLREKFFEQNGGVFLKQKLRAPGASDVVTMFSTQQLQKATNNYSEDRIVGKGGYGVVYRGILPDERVVAIKKSKVVDGTQTEQFINEVLILTQVIHRNVVKLLGCCLEEEVPVLVYEFISNNTLFYHIHHKSGGMSWLSWENRLRVAAEAASALAYLHSQATMPIIHRDVKSANILLDENYTTKIADFGASRSVPLDHEQVTTLVQGTLGYLDPEYFHTSQLTDKSDVYSFGMVLAELITGKKTLCASRTNQEKNLATYFVNSMKENRLFETVEPRLLREGTLEQLQTVAELIKRCLNLLGANRPTMKEVAMELEGLRKIRTHPPVQQQTSEESIRLTLEIEESDLYGVPLIPYSSNEWEPYSGITETTFQENKPR